MKQVARRLLALLIAFAMVLAVAVPAFAQENDELYDDEPEVNEDYTPEGEQPAPNSVSVTITEETFFSFTPNATGYWTFVTSNNNNSAPQLTLTNYYGHRLASNSGGAADNNAIIKLHLVEGAPYVVQVGCRWAWDDEKFSFTLTVFMSDEFVRPVRPGQQPTEIPGDGGRFYGFDRLLYSFTPDTSGLWDFRATSSGDALELEITDWYGNFIAFHMDMEPEFHGTVRLIGGVEYLISGWVDDWETWSALYSLYVSPADTFVPWLDWDMLVDELSDMDLDFDFDAEMTVIPPGGGDFDVNAAMGFTFTPNSYGPWILSTTGSADSPLIIITDTYGSFFTWDGFGWREPFLFIDLSPGVEYIIWVSSFWDIDTSFVFSVELFDFDEYNWEDDWDDWGWEDDWYNPMLYVRIPSAGGYARADRQTGFLFSPESTGSWSIKLSNVEWGELSISDYTNSFWINEFDNAFVSMHMAAGTEYIISTWSNWGANAIVSISPTYQISPPSSVTSAYRRVVRETEFAFTPNHTGYWVIYTFNRAGATDPYLWLLDADGNIIAQDDDGEGLNALIKIYLEAGIELTIRAGYFAGGGEYMLAVRQAGATRPERELTVLVPPAR